MPIFHKAPDSKQHKTQFYHRSEDNKWHYVKNMYSKQTDGKWHPVYSYSWVPGPWGTCSKTCGGGTQTRSLTCTRSDNIARSDIFCNDLAKPATIQDCNTHSCLVRVQLSAYYIDTATMRTTTYESANRANGYDHELWDWWIPSGSNIPWSRYLQLRIDKPLLIDINHYNGKDPGSYNQQVTVPDGYYLDVVWYNQMTGFFGPWGDHSYRAYPPAWTSLLWSCGNVNYFSTLSLTLRIA